MADWNKVVRERLSLVDLSPAEQKEIIAELAGHLDDLYEQCRRQGMSESQAVRRTSDEISNPARLARTIAGAKHQEGNMNHRTKHLWLPGLASLIAAAVLLPLEIGLGIRDSFLHLPLAMTAIFPWLANMLLSGGVAAYLSRRGGGTRLARLLGLIPSRGIFPLFLPGLCGPPLRSRSFHDVICFCHRSLQLGARSRRGSRARCLAFFGRAADIGARGAADRNSILRCKIDLR